MPESPGRDVTPQRGLHQLPPHHPRLHPGSRPQRSAHPSFLPSHTFLMPQASHLSPKRDREGAVTRAPRCRLFSLGLWGVASGAAVSTDWSLLGICLSVSSLPGCAKSWAAADRGPACGSGREPQRVARRQQLTVAPRPWNPILPAPHGPLRLWCPTLCNPMNRSTPGLPVPHHLPEFAQTHVH